MDLKLPLVHGFDVWRWIKEESFFPHVPVVILSSSFEAEDHKKARELGAQKFIVKPPTPESLDTTLKEFKVVDESKR